MIRPPCAVCGRRLGTDVAYIEDGRFYYCATPATCDRPRRQVYPFAHRYDIARARATAEAQP